MNAPSILPYGRQTISEEDIAAVVEVLRGDFLTQGPAVERFEKALAEFIGCKHVIVVNSGTAALHVAYAALGIGTGDAVIVPAITFAATANAAVYCGATPVFADVDAASGLMTPETCKVALDEAVRRKLRPRLVVPVHYAGLPVDMAAICSLAESYDATVFEDACHALGAEYRASESDSWLKVGNWGAGSIGAAFSFHPVKHIATGEGGAIATNVDEIAAKARLLRTHGITKDSSQLVRTELATDHTSHAPNPWYYEMQALGWNYRMPDICAALGLSQLAQLSKFISKRREIAAAYDHGFNVASQITVPKGDSTIAKHGWHLYPVQLDFDALNFSRATFMKRLRDKGIGSQVHYLPVPEMPYYQKSLSRHIAPQSFAQAKKFYETVLSIPMYPDLTKDQVANVINGVVESLAK